MRNELKPLLNQPVVVYGHCSSIKRGSAVEMLCLSKVVVYKWDLHKTIQNQPSNWRFKGQPLRGNPVFTDHLWVLNDSSKHTRLTDDESAMYSKGGAAGFISRYVRADGSVDYGLDSVAPATQDHWDVLFELRKHGMWERMLQQIEIAEEGRGILFCATKQETPKELARRLARLKLEAERQFAITAHTLQLVFDEVSA